MKIVQPSAKLVWITPNAAQVIEMGARVCYKSEDRYDPTKTADFLDRICNQYHHESVVEHASACFDVVTDRGALAEITRHRLASFSVESTRYCNYGKDKFGKQISVLLPPGIDPSNPDGSYDAWVRGVEAAEEAYFALLDTGHSPQIARSVLPMCLKTEFRITANLREWKHILRLRTAKTAHPQIREVADIVQAILCKEVPEIFGQPQSS